MRMLSRRRVRWHARICARPRQLHARLHISVNTMISYVVGPLLMSRVILRCDIRLCRQFSVACNNDMGAESMDATTYTICTTTTINVRYVGELDSYSWCNYAQTILTLIVLRYQRTMTMFSNTYTNTHKARATNINTPRDTDPTAHTSGHAHT